MPNDWLQHPGQNYGTWFYWYDDNDPEHDNHSLLAGCYPNGSFPHKGRYYVTFEAYNRFASPNQSSGTPATKDNYSMYNALEVPYYVVDCSEAHTVNQNFVRVLILQFMPVPLILAQPLMSRLLQVLQLHVNLVHHP
jgi:hypothetical protein